jgi:hypothetical protein
MEGDTVILAVTTRIYFPVVACIVISIVATIVLNLYLRWKR